MKIKMLFLMMSASVLQINAQEASVSGPDGQLKVDIYCPKGGEAVYTVDYNGTRMLEKSPLGFKSNIGDFSKGLTLNAKNGRSIDTTYVQTRIKKSNIHYKANELTCSFTNAKGQKMDIIFRVSANDVAFRYAVPRQGETGSIVINEEATGFRLPTGTTTFLSPQSDAMIGWKRTKPSYEEEYIPDDKMDTRSKYGHGYTFPALFNIGGKGWVLVSETGVDSRYCASRLSDCKEGNLYTVAFPMPEENNGNGTSSPAFALPGKTPWRTVTVGETLQPIAETTVTWDVVEPAYTTKHQYKMGRGTWSWILWQDGSINYDDQVKFIDFAADMGYEYVLVDNWWDTRIGHKKMEELVKYAQSKGVDVFLWYSSSGYWNDIVQGPTNLFGGDKQETMRLYESILSDADDNGLMVIFHGCTIPRGWERMYPNYVGSEAVLASENLVFNQHFCDNEAFNACNEAFNACLHPFIRNTVGCMEFGGCVLNKRLNRNNDGGTTRKTSDVFQLATGILFQNPIQNFALAPNNLTDAPKICMDFMKQIPTEWDETVFVDGYPGRYAVLARKHGDKWYIAGINATDKAMNLKVALPFIAGKNVQIYEDNKKMKPTLNSKKIGSEGKITLTIRPQGGTVVVSE